MFTNDMTSYHYYHYFISVCHEKNTTWGNYVYGHIWLLNMSRPWALICWYICWFKTFTRFWSPAEGICWVIMSGSELVLWFIPNGVDWGSGYRALCRPMRFLHTTLGKPVFMELVLRTGACGHRLNWAVWLQSFVLASFHQTQILLGIPSTIYSSCADVWFISWKIT